MKKYLEMSEFRADTINNRCSKGLFFTRAHVWYAYESKINYIRTASMCTIQYKRRSKTPTL